MDTGSGESMHHLSIPDYIVFALSLVLSACIGLYYYFTGGRQRTTKEYLLGDQKMSIWPVAFSLMASFMSAITLLGVPSENYSFSTQFFMINISYIIGTPIACFIFLPVFFEMQATSAYEYLEKRFSRSVRTSASIVFMLQMILYMAIVLYAPALALSAVTGLSKWASIVSVGAVCTLYCTTGGIKAVIWTDLFQCLLMFAAMLLIIIKGCIDVGGIDKVWRTAEEGGRIQFLNISPDPTERHTVWSLAIGGIWVYVSLYGVNQTQVQRLLTIKSLKKAQISLALAWPITTFLSLITSFSGIVMYAYFVSCDPLKDPSSGIKSSDQLLPYFVMKTLGSYPGLPGLFIAGVFSGALSTVSSFVNSLAAVTLEDYLKPYLWKRGIKDESAARVSKFLALFYGILCIFLTYVVSKMAGILQASLTIFGVVGGPLLGLFSLGMMTRTCNARGALAGFLISLAIGLWISFGAVKAGIAPQPLPSSTDSCPAMNHDLSIIKTSASPYLNSTILDGQTSHMNNDQPFYLYRISYMWYAFFTWVIEMIVGLGVSLVFPGKRKQVPEEYLAPYLRRSRRRRESFSDAISTKSDGFELQKSDLQKGDHTFTI